MPPRVAISVRRPVRSTALEEEPQPLKPIPSTAIPNVDLDSPGALAFAMRGRAAAASHQEIPQPLLPTAPISQHLPSSPGFVHNKAPSATGVHTSSVEAEANQVDDQRLIAIKLPIDAGKRLARIADRRGSKRTHVAVEALDAPLRQLAAAHRAGEFPELPKVTAGNARNSIAFSLPADLAADLDYILRARKAVRAQIVTRLLVPAIEALHADLFGRQ